MTMTTIAVTMTIIAAVTAVITDILNVKKYKGRAFGRGSFHKNYKIAIEM